MDGTPLKCLVCGREIDAESPHGTVTAGPLTFRICEADAYYATGLYELGRLGAAVIRGAKSLREKWTAGEGVARRRGGV